MPRRVTTLAAQAVCVALLAALTTVDPVATAPAVADAVPVDRRVYMVADSVGLGSAGAIQRALPEYQVTLDGTPGIFVEQLEAKWVHTRMATNPSVFGDVAVVAAGYNFPYWDPPRFDRAIDSMIDALERAGAKYIVWVTLRELKPEYITAGAWRQAQSYSFYLPTVNAHLRAATARHSNLSLADWAAVADRPGLTYDAIHLNTTGAALYSETIADVVRNVPTQREAGTTSEVTVTGVNGVPIGARAVTVNLTVTSPRAAGYLAAFACGAERPATSSLNFVAGQTVAVSAIVDVGSEGRICVFNSQRTQVIVDVQGYFGASSSYVAVPPARLHDTRVGAGSAVHPAAIALAVPVVGVAGVPIYAVAVALNVTLTDQTLAGYATVYPCDAPQPSPIALVNFLAGIAMPNFAVVKPAADGTVCISTNVPANIVVDAFGYLPAGSPVIAVAPTRLADTRSGPSLAPNTDLVVPIVGAAGVPAGAAAAVLNITSATPSAAGFIVAYPCGMPTDSSTLNVVAGSNVSNTAIVAPGAGGAVCVRSNIGTHILVDVTGWILDGYVGLTPWRAYDSRIR